MKLTNALFSISLQLPVLSEFDILIQAASYPNKPFLSKIDQTSSFSFCEDGKNIRPQMPAHKKTCLKVAYARIMIDHDNIFDVEVTFAMKKSYCADFVSR